MRFVLINIVTVIAWMFTCGISPFVLAGQEKAENYVTFLVRLASPSAIYQIEDMLKQEVYDRLPEKRKTDSDNPVRMIPLFKLPMQQSGKKYKHRKKGIWLYKIVVPEYMASIVKRTLSENNMIIYIEKNIRYRCPPAVDSDSFNNKSSLKSADKTDSQYYHRELNTNIAWLYSKGEGIVVAVLDTGINEHPTLEGKLFVNKAEIPENGLDDDGNGYIDDNAGYDFVDAEDGIEGEDNTGQDNDASDTDGHGTAISAIIAGDQSSSGLLIGVAPEVRILNVRTAYTDWWGGVTLEADDIVEAVYYAVDMGADVINMSWGGYFDSQAVHDVLYHASQAGCVIVASTGNENTDEPIYPASYAEVISVGAYGTKGQPAYFSNYGEHVNIYAPGVDIVVADLNGGIKFVSGTSYACGIVSGVSAVLKSVWTGDTDYTLMELAMQDNTDSEWVKLPDLPALLCALKKRLVLEAHDHDKDGEITVFDVMHFEFSGDAERVNRYWNCLRGICKF